MLDLVPSGDEFDNGANWLPNAVPRRRLDTAPRLRREAVRLYTRWDAGTLEAEVAAKMIYALRTILAMIEGSETSRRLDQLEAKVAELSAP